MQESDQAAKKHDSIVRCHFATPGLLAWFAPLLALFIIITASQAAAPSSLQLLQTVTLEGIEGRFDHFTADVKGERLFVAALGNNSVEVIDLKAGKRIQALRAVQKPAGVLYLPDSNRLYVASGGDNSLKIFDGASFELLKSISG